MICSTLPQRPRRRSRSARRIFSTNTDVLSVSGELIARRERDGSPDLVADAVRILGEMEQALAQMEAHHAAAQEQPPKVSVDEPNPANVAVDTRH